MESMNLLPRRQFLQAGAVAAAGLAGAGAASAAQPAAAAQNGARFRESVQSMVT